MCERALSDVSSLVFAAPSGGFQTIGVVGGQVEPGPVAKRAGCSSVTGLNAASLAEAELDKRELALALVVGSVVGSGDKQTL